MNVYFWNISIFHQGRTSDFEAPGITVVMGPSHVGRDRELREDTADNSKRGRD